MRQQVLDSSDLTHPALVVTFGNTTKKRRLLNKAITTIGHSPACDIMINSPDVAAVHSVLVQLEDGLWVRNCATKLSTRVNGNVVQEIRLQDNDILQIGAFVFQIQLPPKKKPKAGEGTLLGGSLLRSNAAADTQRNDASETAKVPNEQAPKQRPSRAIDLVELGHLKRSRRNLCRLALLMRERLRKAESANEKWLEEQRERAEEIEEQEAELRQQAEELDEREEALQRDEHYLDTRAQQLEKELAERQKKVEAEIAEAWKAHQERCCQAPTAESAESTEPSSEDEKALHIRRTELDRYAKHLMNERQALQTEVSDQLRKLEEELEQLRNENKTLRVAKKDLFPNEELEAIRNENETLRKQLEQVPEASVATMLAHQSAQRDHEREKLRSELLKLEDQLRKRDSELRALQSKLSPKEDATEQTIATLRDHIGKLETKLRESEAEVERLSMQLDDWNMPVNLEHSGGYERELHRFRVELERDRKEMDVVKRQLEQRAVEIKDLARNTELELSRERAMVSRERAELNRMREEIRVDRERLQRETRSKERLPGRSLEEIEQLS